MFLSPGHSSDSVAIVGRVQVYFAVSIMAFIGVNREGESLRTTKPTHRVACSTPYLCVSARAGGTVRAIFLRDFIDSDAP